MRTCLIGLSTALLVVIVSACGGGGSSTSSSSGSGSPGGGEAPSSGVAAPAALVHEGRFSACLDPSFPPMESIEGSEPVGFDVDLATAVAEEWGVEPSFQKTQFTGLLPAVASERCDVAWSAMFITPERTANFPAVPYLKTGSVLMVSGGNPDGVESPQDLSGKTVTTESGTEYPARLKALGKELEAEGMAPPKVQTYPTQSEAAQQLVVGRAAATLTQDTEAAYRETQLPGEFSVGFRYPADDTFGVYYQKSKPELGKALKEALMALKEDGTLDELAEKYGIPAEQLIAG